MTSHTKSTEYAVQEILERVTRLESKVVQLMIFMGADPEVKYYVGDTKPKVVQLNP